VVLVLDATAGGASSNSYVSLADAETYFEGRPFASAWTGADQADKEQALVYATTILERERWAGCEGGNVQAALTQALAWPRRWVPTLEWDAAPQLVAEFFIDTATRLLRGAHGPHADRARDVRARARGPARRRYGSVQRQQHEQHQAGEDRPARDGVFRADELGHGLGFYPNVVALIAPLLRSSAGMQSERV
jgi:hypothetical protein